MNEDFTDSLGIEASTGDITDNKQEAPILFQRKGLNHHLLHGHTYCFWIEWGWCCSNGCLKSSLTLKDTKVDLNPTSFMSIDHVIRGQTVLQSERR